MATREPVRDEPLTVDQQASGQMQAVPAWGDGSAPSQARRGWLACTWAAYQGLIQLVALVICLLGIVLTALAAVRAANPLPQVVVTLAAAAVLLMTVLRPERA